MKRTLVVGATTKPERYANIAVRRLRQHGHDVEAVGRMPGTVGDVTIETDWSRLQGPFDTVTMYVGEAGQRELEDRILALHPKRIVFNPGAENDSLSDKAAAQGIETVEGCTLVMLSAGTY